MFKTNLKIIFRKLMKDKIYSFINVFGLAVGLAAAALILLYVQYELSFDLFHDNAGRIFRVVHETNFNNKRQFTAYTGAPMAPNLVNDFAEITHAVRFYPVREALVTVGDHSFKEKNFYFADSCVFDIFSFPLIQGNPKTALAHANTVAITRRMAEKYFADSNPIGKRITYDKKFVFTITGVLENPPENSHFTFDFLASFHSLQDIFKTDFSSWWWPPSWTYIFLENAADAPRIAAALPDFVTKYRGEQLGSLIKPQLQPLTRIHLYSHYDGELGENGNISFLVFFAIIDIFILAIAGINFMNLSTAQAGQRAREIGVRKVFGARRAALIRQLLFEAIVFSLLSLAVALLIIELVLPAFRELTNRPLALGGWQNTISTSTILLMALLTGIASGSYAAFYLTKFNPVKALKFSFLSGPAKSFQRNALVVLQFVISIFLIFATLVVYKQLAFVHHKNLGFSSEHNLIIPIDVQDLKASRNSQDALKQEILKNAQVIRATAASGLPGIFGGGLMPIRAEGVSEQEDISMQAMRVDEDFLATLDITLLSGRDFSKNMSSDFAEAFFLNEAAVRRLGWTVEDTPGKQFEAFYGEAGKIVFQRKGKVIGVVKDFHVSSLHNKVDPLVLFLDPYITNYLIAKASAQNMPQTLADIEKVWQKFAPGYPFDYAFLDETIDKLYKSEIRLGEIFGYFSTLAIVIACLGLFGLAAYAAERRTKEIGVRKVLGASVSGVVTLLSKDFVKLVLLANLIAWPVAWYAMNKWLQNFAYRISIEWWIFALAGWLALVIALLTVSTQAVRAALANPVDSLRYE